MFHQHPVILLILFGITLVLVIKQCFNQHRFLKYRFVILAFLIFISSLLLVFYSQLEEKYSEIIDYIILSLEIINGLFLFFSFNSTYSKDTYNSFLLSTLEETKFFVLLDKKDRVKEISMIFCDDLNQEKVNLVGKNFFDCIEMKYRVVGLNQTECNAEYLKNYYLTNENRNDLINQMELNLKQLDEDVSFYLIEKNIFHKNRYKGRILIGDKKDSINLMGMEKDLVKTNSELEVIKNRFITILEKTKEGIFFNDITNGYIWVNDVLVEKLALNGNTLSMEEFHNLIIPEDRVMYQDSLANVTNDKPDYSLTYRFNTGYSSLYIKEVGKKITTGKEVEFCGIMIPADNYRFERTETILDSISYEPEMLAKLNTLQKEERVFLICHIKIESIPEINDKFGRQIGNLMLSQYIEFFKNKFVDNNFIYRISGLEFIAYITDYRKMDILKNNLVNGEKLLHLEADYLNDKIKTTVCMGLSYSNDSLDPKEALVNAKEALKFASNPQFNSNFAYYKDIK